MASRKELPSTNESKRILNSIRLLVRALRVFDREAQKRYGLSAAAMFILHALHDVAAPVSLNELAERTATDQSSASVVVQRLVDAGYVSRTPRPEDRRHVELRLTPRGRTLIRNTPPPAQERILAAVAAMPRADQRRFADLFEQFVASVSARRKEEG
jgi:DNA-binding MarR family transcriptional regulator